MALLGEEQIEFPEHLKIRRGLQQCLNRISCSKESKCIIQVASQKAFTASTNIEKPAKDICRSVSHQTVIAFTTEKPTMAAKTQLELGHSVKTSGAPASVKPGAAAVSKLVLLASPSVRPTSSKTGAKINANKSSKPLIKIYKTKFSSHELKSSPLKYPAVTITRMTHPRSIYIRIEDDDALRYLQLLKEMGLEFRSATTTSATFCSSPIIGVYYTSSYIFY